MVIRLVFVIIFILSSFASSAFAGVDGWTSTAYISRASAVVTAMPFSFSAWVWHADAVAGVDPVVCANSADINERRGYLTVTSTAVRAEVRAGGAFGTASTGAAASTGQWVHEFGAFIDTGTTYGRRALVDGANAGSNTTSLDPGASTKLRIGQCANIGNMDADDGIAEVSAWACCTTDTASDALAVKLAAKENPLAINAEAGQAWTGTLVAYWPIPSETKMLTDLSGNGNTLSEIGTALNNFADHPLVEIYPSVLEAFTVANGTNLDVLDTRWIQLDAVAEVQTNVATLETAATDALYHWNQIMPSADGKICMDITAIGAGTAPYAGVKGRVTTNVLGTTDGYGLNVDLVSGAGNETIELYSITDGVTDTILDTLSEDLGASFTLCLNMSGTTLTGTVDDVTKVSHDISGDTPKYEAAGYVGFFIGASAGGTDLTVDNFTYAAADAVAASTRRPITPIIMNYIEPEGITPWASLKQAWSRLFGLFH